MRLIATNRSETESIYCPNSGFTGGPMHPAHAGELAVARRVDAAVEELPAAVDRAMHEQGMRLFGDTIGPRDATGYYFQVAYLQCLTCGLVLPVQQVRTPTLT
jgi:hypothetical protein